MFDHGSPLDSAALAGLVDQLAHLEEEVDDAERIDQLRLLERLKSAATAAQAKVTAAFAASQRQLLRDQEVPRARQGRPIAAQVALARRDSPTMGSRHLGVAEALVHEMPGTYDALRRGEISEWRATIVVRETACLSREDRTAVDAELAPRLGRLGDRQTGNEARRIAYRLDPHSVMNRVRGAERDRRVTIRPAPDTMSLVTGFLPAKQGVAVYAALSRHADTRRSAGDERSRSQIMADEYVDRLTGNATTVAGRGESMDTATAHDATSAAGSKPSTETTVGAEDAEGAAASDFSTTCTSCAGSATDVTTTTRVDLDVQLVMTEATLFRGDDAPATLVGYGPIPAPLARRLVREADEKTRVFVRRLYADPATGELAAMESKRRCFDPAMRQFLVFRDEVCRTPWCSAPIRHSDHVVPDDEGGPTSVDNGQGLCEACNYVKQSPGWKARTQPGGLIETTTPTGHSYASPASPVAPARPPVRWPTERVLRLRRRLEPDGGSVMEDRLRMLLTHAGPTRD